MTKAEKLFYNAREIARKYADSSNFVVGSEASVKALTQAIKIIERELRLDSLLKNANVDVQERNNFNKKVIAILTKSKEVRVKRIKCEKEITKRCNAYANTVKEFDYFALVRKTDEIRKEVEAEFYGK